MRWHKDDDDQEDNNCGKAGFYHCQVLKVVPIKKPDKDFEQWNIYFIDIHSGEEISIDRLFFSKKAAKFARKKIEILGMVPDENGFIDFEPDQLKGKQAILELVEDEYLSTKVLIPNFNSDHKGFGYQEPTEENMKKIKLVKDIPF